MSKEKKAAGETVCPESGPCAYCGKETTHTCLAPTWSYEDTEGFPVWVCESEVCLRAYEDDPYNNWNAYWANI